VLQLRHVFLGRAFLRERPWQHELGLEHRITALHASIQSRAHPAQHGVADLTLDVDDHLSGIGLIPASVQLLGRNPELHDEITGQVLRFDLAALLAPQPDQGGFLIPHDDAGVRTADEVSPRS
jgi:hypothetical protein